MKNTMVITALLGLAAALVAAPAVYAQGEAKERQTRSDEDRRSGQDAELAGLDEADKAAGEHGAEGRAIARKATSAKGPAAAEVAGETGKPSFLKGLLEKLKGGKGKESKAAAQGKRSGGGADDAGTGREGKADLGLDKADEAAGEHGAEGRAIARESVKKDASEGAIGAEKREKAMEKAKETREERGQRDRGERERGLERRGSQGGPMGGPGGAGGGRPGGGGR